MGKGAKIALGCGVVVLLAGAAVIGLVGYGAYQAKSKLAEMSGGLDRIAAKTREIDTWEKKANANAYTAPADGVIPEARFVKFLDARKRVFAVYEGYQAELKQLEARSKAAGDKPSFSDALNAGGKIAQIFGDCRLALVKALADLGMNEQEYRDIQMAVYKTAWAAESQKQSGKTPSEQMAELQKAMRQGFAEARKSGVPGAESLGAGQEQGLSQSADELAKAAKSLDVPQANIDLFRKYEADIKKYAMSGLEMIGM